MIVSLSLAALLAPQTSAPAPPAPPEPSRSVDVPGYTSRCYMKGLNDRRFAVTMTVSGGRRRRATITTDAPDLVPQGTYRADGAIKGWHWSGRVFNEDVRIDAGGGFRAVQSWSNTDGDGSLTILPRGGNLSDPRTASGRCRIAWTRP